MTSPTARRSFLRAEMAAGMRLLTAYSRVRRPGQDWPLFVKIEQVCNTLTINGATAAADVIGGAYTALARFVSPRIQLAADAASPFSRVNFYPAGHPQRVDAEAKAEAVRAAALAFPAQRDRILADTHAKLSALDAQLAGIEAHRVAA